jgi:mycothiol synthase
MNFTTRPFEQDDYPTLQALSREIYRLAGPPVYATPGDLDWWRCVDEDPQAILGAQVWMDGARMVAFIWPFPKSVDMLVHPDTPELNNTILAWAEDNHRSIIGADEETQTLRAGA